MAKHKLSPYAADPIKRGETVRKYKRSTRHSGNASPVPVVTWPDPLPGWVKVGANKRTAMYRKFTGGRRDVPSLIVGKRRKGKPDRWVVSTERRVPQFDEAGDHWGMFTTVEEELFVADNHETVWVWVSIEETNAAATSYSDSGTVTGRRQAKAMAFGAAYGAGKTRLASNFVGQPTGAGKALETRAAQQLVDMHHYLFDELTKM